MKILIADDEALARTTLRSILQELAVPLEALDEATNGEELVAQVQRTTPDVVFVDIKMPKLNGLEAIRQAKELAPDARWYIMTGFSKFAYAQEALRIGVSDYLLKPVDPHEVQKVISQVIIEQKKRLLTLNRHFERDLAALYHGLISLQQEEPDSLLKKAHFLGAIFYIDSSLPEAEKAQRQREFLHDVQLAVNDILADSIRIALFSVPSGEIALIGAWRTEHEAQGEQLCRRCLQRVESLLPHYADATLCITMLQAAEGRSYEELYERLNWLQEVAALRAVYGIGKKIHSKDLAHYATEDRLLALSGVLEKLIFFFREKLYVQYMQTVEHMADALADGEIVDYGTKRSIATFLCHALPCRITPSQTSNEWKHVLQACGDQRLLAQPRRHQGDMLAQVMQLIDQSYQSDLSITQIAERLQVTPNYLSALFHKKVGTTFIKYLTRIRLLRAKELLADSDLRVQEVAEAVGYTSTRHFTKLFTAFFGYYPSEQRKKPHLAVSDDVPLPHGKSERS